MFEFIGNTIRVIANDIEDSIANSQIKAVTKEQEEFGKSWRSHCAQIDALDPDTSDARQWCFDNDTLPKPLEDRIWASGSVLEIMRKKTFMKAEYGMDGVLAAVRSKVTGDCTGFGTWIKELRIAEIATLKFLGEDKYDSYDDISDDEVPDIVELLDFDNPYGIIISNEMIEEAFLRVQEHPPVYMVQVDILADDIRMIPISRPRLDDDVNVETLPPEKKDMPNSEFVDTEVVDGKATPIHEGADAEGMHTVRFYHPEEEDEYISVAVEVDRRIYDKIEEFIKKAGYEKKRRMYNSPNTVGFYEICFDNLTSIAVDPGIIAGNGINFVGTARIFVNGIPQFVTALVNLEDDFEIAKKIMSNPEYVLTEDEHRQVASRLYPDMEIYNYIDFSEMTDTMRNLSDADRFKLGQKLSAITNLMVGGEVAKARFRFFHFENVDTFTLVSDQNVKAPLSTMIRTTLPRAFIVDGDVISYNAIKESGEIGDSVMKYDIQYN